MLSSSMASSSVRLRRTNSGAVTISGGVASYPQDAPSEVERIRAADHALYQAKNGGRNCVRVAPPASDAGKPENDTLSIAGAS